MFALAQVLLVAVISSASNAAEYRYEATREDSIIRAVRITVSQNRKRADISFTYHPVLVDAEGGIKIQQYVNVSTDGAYMEGPQQIDVRAIPKGVELPGIGEADGDGKVWINYSFITTGKLNALDYAVTKNRTTVVQKGRLVLTAQPSESYRKTLSAKLTPGAKLPTKDNDCVSLLGQNCASFAAARAKAEPSPIATTASTPTEPYAFLDKEWRLPRFGEPPASPAQTSSSSNVDLPVTSVSLPYVQLRDKLDFPKLVELANVVCKDSANCPSSVGLLIGLQENDRAYQCTTDYWHEGGWFATNAHCIPDDLRKAGGLRKCDGRIFVKMPATANAQPLTVECDRIEFVSSYDPSSSSPDMAYFRVKAHDELKKRQALKFDYNVKALDLNSSIHLFAVNPVPDKEGLNGEVERKTCRIQDPLNLRTFFPQESQGGYPLIYYSNCESNTIGGNSGSAIRMANGNAIGWHSAVETSTAGEHRLGTAARCFAPLDLSLGDARPGQYSYCEVLKHDRIQLVATRAKLNVAVKVLDVLDTVGREKDKQIAELQRRNGELDLKSEKASAKLQTTEMEFKETKTQKEGYRIASVLGPLVGSNSKGILGVRVVAGSNNFVEDYCVNEPKDWIEPFMVNPWFDFTIGNVVPEEEIVLSIKLPVGKMPLGKTWGAKTVADLGLTSQANAKVLVRGLRSPLNPKYTNRDFEGFIFFEQGHPDYSGSWLPLYKCRDQLQP